MKTLLLVISILSFSVVSGQVFEKYKLLPAEIPEKYRMSEKMLCKSIQPKIFYDNPDLYQGILGTVKSKDFQSFDSKDDQGTALFFEYENRVEGEGFLEGLLWGGSKPTKEHPEEYLIKDNILIIWSFTKKSEVKNISRQKIKSTR
jgi:hypothetical protein